MPNEALTCWVLSDGRRGIENQALGLAEAMSRLRPLQIQKFEVKNTGLFKALPPLFQHTVRKNISDYGLPNELPKLVIGCGRQAIAPLIALRKQGVFTVCVQDPRINAAHFDVVIAPDHDAIKGDNVLKIVGSTNRVTAEKIDEETKRFSEKLSTLPKPRAAVLVGGHSKTHVMTPDVMNKFIQAIGQLNHEGYSLLLSNSRRTPEIMNAVLKDMGQDYDKAWFFDSRSDDPNPYFAFLGAADVILVTEESTNMLTEGCATGKPVYRLPMKGNPGKFQKLYDALKQRCNVIPYGTGQADGYIPLNETDRAARWVWDRMENQNV